MDISRTRVVLRERPVVDILDLGLRFLAQHWAVYAKLALVVVPPLLGASCLVGYLAGPYLAWGFAIFFAGVARAPFTLLASRLVFEDDVRLSRVLGGALAATPRLMVLHTLSGLAAGLGVFPFMFPGIWFLGMLFFVTEVLVLERAGISGSIKRSRQLFKRESSAPILALLLLSLAHAGIVMLADSGGRTLISALLESHAPEAVWAQGWSALAMLGFWLFVPYAATTRFFVYLDVRTRSEGWDIQTRFLALASRTDAPTISKRAA
jgi:hypothetical protein